MRRVLPILFVGVAATACGDDTNTDEAEEAAATEVGGKSDSLFAQIVFGQFENPSAETGEFVSMELTDVPRSELPAAHFEGRYTLSEMSADGERSSEGAFNVYRYDGTDWIRFVGDDSKPGTSQEKYAWSSEGDTMTFRTPKGASFTMQLVGGTEPVVYECGYGVDGSDYLEYDVSDPYRQRPAEPIASVTADNLSTVSGSAADIATDAAATENMSLADYLATFDDGTLNVYDLTWFTSAYEMASGLRDGEEHGVIFSAGIRDEPRALVIAGEIFDCRNGECETETSDFFPPSSESFHQDALATELAFVDSADEMTEVIEGQMRVALLETSGWEDYSESSKEELLDSTDDGGFWYYEVGDLMHWLRWYGGDTEVGAFFEKGTTNLVGTVGDGNVSACTAAE